MLRHAGDGTVEVSLSHDERACLCVAGSGPHGCDVAVVTERTREQWQALLGSGADALLAAAARAGRKTFRR